MRHSFTGVLTGFVVVGIVMILIERLAGPNRSKPFWRAGALADITWWFVTPLVTRAISPVVIGLSLLPVAFLIGYHGRISAMVQGFGPLSHQPKALQIFEMLVLLDFIGYWMHRGFHGRLLWPFHAVHHSSPKVDWLASVRVHPVNDVVNRLAGALPLLALGFSPAAFAGVVPFLTLYAIMLHADVDWDFGPLRGVIASPRFHQWHHSLEDQARQCNFAGFFPLWDRLFGTYYMPGRATRAFGIDEPMPASFLGQLAYPFRRREQAGAPVAAE